MQRRGRIFWYYSWYSRDRLSLVRATEQCISRLVFARLGFRGRTIRSFRAVLVDFVRFDFEQTRGKTENKNNEK